MSKGVFALALHTHLWVSWRRQRFKYVAENFCQNEAS